MALEANKALAQIIAVHNSGKKLASDWRKENSVN